MKKEKFFGYVGWIGMCTSILMYVFYFPQIQENLNGNKGSFIQPFMAGINCTLWVCYGLFKEKRDLGISQFSRCYFRFFRCVYGTISRLT